MVAAETSFSGTTGCAVGGPAMLAAAALAADDAEAEFAVRRLVFAVEFERVRPDEEELGGSLTTPWKNASRAKFLVTSVFANKPGVEQIFAA